MKRDARFYENNLCKNSVRLALGLMLFFGGCGAAQASDEKKFNYVPPNGVVPDDITAVHIAEAVLLPIYGEGVLKNERPLKAHLHDGVWAVTGTLSDGVVGGVAEVEIAKINGAIIRISHGQ